MVYTLYWQNDLNIDFVLYFEEMTTSALEDAINVQQQGLV